MAKYDDNGFYNDLNNLSGIEQSKWLAIEELAMSICMMRKSAGMHHEMSLMATVSHVANLLYQ